MVLFEITGNLWPLDDRTAELVATSARVAAAKGVGTSTDAGYVFLADAIESHLVGASEETIAIDEDAADAFLRTLNIVIRDPAKAEPSYALYLELRRFLGRLYS